MEQARTLLHEGARRLSVVVGCIAMLVWSISFGIAWWNGLSMDGLLAVGIYLVGLSTSYFLFMLIVRGIFVSISWVKEGFDGIDENESSNISVSSEEPPPEAKELRNADVDPLKGLDGQGSVAAQTAQSGERSRESVPYYRDVTVGVVDGPMERPSTPGSKPSPLPRSTSTKPRDVGGWLLLFCVGIAIIGPVLTYGKMINQFVEAKPTFDVFPGLAGVFILESTVLSALLVYGIVVGLTVWRGDVHGNRIAEKYLRIRIFTFVGLELFVLLALLSYGGEIADAAVGDVFAVLFRELLFFGVWYTYFKRSRRVRATYSNV